MKNTPDHNISIPMSVLGYWEEGEWVALALEMDLRGYGETFEDAFKNLEEAIEEQICFAVYKQDLGLIQHRAEDRYFRMFREARNAALREVLMEARNEIAEAKNVDERRRETTNSCATFFNFLPDPHIIASRSAAFNAI